MAQNRDASDGTGCQQPEGPVLCSNNCGFLACSATMNLCSKCYRELVLKQGNHCPPLPPHSENVIPGDNIVPDGDSSLLTRSDLARSALFASLAAPFSPQEGIAKPFYNSSCSQISDADELSPSSSSSSLRCPPPKEGAVSTPAAAYLKSRSSSHQIGKRHTGNRCLTCGRRVGLLGFKCRCGDLFCATHRYSDKHSCSFDYKAAGREAIAKANPVVVAEKVKKI